MLTKVAGDDRSVHVLENRVRLAESIDLGLDLVVTDDRRRDRHTK